MSDIVKGIQHLIASLFDIIKGIFTTALHVSEGAVSAVVGLIKSVFSMAEGIVGFIIGNIFLLGTLAAVYFGYIAYQQRQGKQPAPVSRAMKSK